MNTKAELDTRVLNAAELEMLNATRSPEIEAISPDELKSIGRRLRQAHARAKDIGARQQREMRGKAKPRGSAPAKDNAGTLAKAHVLYGAIQRVDEELSRREQASTPMPSQAALSRHALELKIKSEARQHPDPGRWASQGMQSKKRQKMPPIGTTRKEIGRVSQAGKVAQARKDAGK